MQKSFKNLQITIHLAHVHAFVLVVPKCIRNFAEEKSIIYGCPKFPQACPKHESKGFKKVNKHISRKIEHQKSEIKNEFCVSKSK